MQTGFKNFRKKWVLDQRAKMVNRSVEITNVFFLRKNVKTNIVTVSAKTKV